MEEKQLTSRELEEQANALLAEADFEEINLPKKAKKAAAAKKANEDTAQAEKPAEKFPPLDEKLVASLPAAALLQGNEKLMEIFAKGKAKGKLSSSDLMETIDEMNLESEQLDQIYDSLETLGIDIGTAEAIEAAKAKLEAGEIHVFDCSTFTVKGETLTSYQADVTADSDNTPDTEVVHDGYFSESEFRSAPYFDLEIDGINRLDVNYGG